MVPTYASMHPVCMTEGRKTEATHTVTCVSWRFQCVHVFFFRRKILTTLPDMFTYEKHELLNYLWQHVVN